MFQGLNIDSEMLDANENYFVKYIHYWF